MEKLVFKTEKEVNLENLNDIIITAIEGGSNYWYFLDREACKIIDQNRGTPANLCFSEGILPAIMAGEEIPVHDIEDAGNPPLGHLSLLSIKSGIEKMMKDGRPEVNILFDEEPDYDAGDADVIFQYFVMGEIVFC